MRSQVATTERGTAWAAEPAAMRRLASLFLAGGLAGVIAGGLGSRVAMRISAFAAPDAVGGLPTEAGATIGRITIEGTVFLVVFAGLTSAVVGTAFYLAVRAWLPSRRWPRALAFGGLELLVFGTTVIDAANPDFTILGRPVLNVSIFASLFVLHGALLVVLQRPARRLIGAVAADGGWRGALVDLATLGAASLTALGVVAVGLQSGGWWNRLWTAALLACATGLAFIREDGPRPLTRPTLRLVGGISLSVIAFSGGVALLGAVRTIV